MMDEIDQAELEEGHAPPITELINNSRLFRSLDDTGRQRLLDLGKVVRFRKGDSLIREGDEGRAFFVVCSGKVKVWTVDDRDEELVLARLGVGAVLGEMAIVTRQRRTAHVQAMEDVEAVAFPEPGILNILQDYPKVLRLLQAISTSRAKDTLEKTCP